MQAPLIASRPDLHMKSDEPFGGSMDRASLETQNARNKQPGALGYIIYNWSSA